MQTIKKIEITRAYLTVHGIHHGIDVYSTKNYLDSNGDVVISRKDGMTFPVNVSEFMQVEDSDQTSTIRIPFDNPYFPIASKKV